MTNAQADEVPFLAGMEREGPICETTIEVGRKAFRLDGMLDRLLAKAREALEARSHDRGPDPDVNGDDEDLRTLMRAFVDMARYAQRNPNPGPGSINGMRSKLMDAVIWVILAVSAWNLKATIDNSRDIAVLQCQINPSCAQAVVRGKQP